LLTNLLQVIQTEDANDESAASQASSLQAITLNSQALPVSAIQSVYEVSNLVLSSSSSAENVVDLLGAIDAAASAVTSYTDASNATAIGNTSTELLRQLSNIHTIAFLETFSQKTLDLMQPDQQQIEQAYYNFKMVSKVVTLSSSSATAGASSTRISFPQSAYEAAFNESVAVMTLTVSNQSNAYSTHNITAISTLAAAYGAVSSRYLSNPVHFKIVRGSSSSDNDNDQQQQAEVLQFDLPLIRSATSGVSSNTSIQFNTSCAGSQDRSSRNFTCPGSNYVIHHNCSGHETAGTLTSHCPVLTSACVIVNTSTGVAVSESPAYQCEMVALTRVYAQCRCTRSASSDRRRVQSAEASLVSLVSTVQYESQQVSGTFAAAPELTTVQSLRKVLIVIILFSSVWASGLMIIFLCAGRYRLKRRKKVGAAQTERMMKEIQQLQSMQASASIIHSHLLDYVTAVFPSVFNPRHSYAQRLSEEIAKHHRYLTLLTSPDGQQGDKARIMTGIQLLCIQTLLMFLLALLYDLQAPDDDGSCVHYSTEQSCLRRKSFLDSQQTYCQWSYDASDQSYGCSYRQPVFTITVMIYIGVLVSLITALFSSPIDSLFDVLTSPTADAVKIRNHEGNSIPSQIARRVSSVARRGSAAVVSSAAAVRKKLMHSLSGKHQVTRVLPDAAAHAHQLAAASMTAVESRVRSSIRQREASRMTRLNSMRYGGNDDAQLRTPSPVNAATVSASTAPLQQVMTTGDGDSMHSLDVGMLCERLMTEIEQQRALLRMSERAEFDAQWGVEVPGMTGSGSEGGDERRAAQNIKGVDGGMMGGILPGNVQSKLREELSRVRALTTEKVEKLSIASDDHAGLEMLHLFVQDLLGRDTPAAIIFVAKSEEDFSERTIYSIWTKRAAGMALVAMNAFFVYYSILKGYQKGMAWQRTFLFACIVQLIVEICINETLECGWIHYVVPSLIHREVQEASESVMRIVTELGTDSSREQHSEQNGSHVLNAPDYLFVSTNVARSLPDLMESLIVQSYQSHLPGELSRKWRSSRGSGWSGGSMWWQLWLVLGGRSDSSNRRAVLSVNRILTMVMVVVVASLQYLGTVPFLIQRLIIRFIEPFVLTVLVLVFEIVRSNPIWTALTVIGIVSVAIWQAIRMRKGGPSPSAVAPDLGHHDLHMEQQQQLQQDHRYHDDHSNGDSSCDEKSYYTSDHSHSIDYSPSSMDEFRFLHAHGISDELTHEHNSSNDRVNIYGVHEVVDVVVQSDDVDDSEECENSTNLPSDESRNVDGRSEVENTNTSPVVYLYLSESEDDEDD